MPWLNMAAGRVGPGLPVLSEYGSDLRSFIEFIRHVLSAKIPDGLSRTRRVVPNPSGWPIRTRAGLRVSHV